MIMQDLSKYLEDGILFDGRYRLIKLLSTEGGTADVWLAENYESVDTKLSEDTDDVVRVEGTGVLVAIKIYRPKNILDVDGEQSFKAEFKTIFNCHHANLLPTTDYSIFEGMPYLVMPFCDNGSAESLVGCTEEADMWKFLADVAAGLSYLHSVSPQIIHQDIKPANILIDTNKNYCITDFGISIKSGVDDDHCIDNVSSGTLIYMPPERFLDGYVPQASSDIWSFGATAYELITGDVPFGDSGGAAQIEGAKVPPIKKPISKRMAKIIYACLDANPKKRPSAEYIAQYAANKGKKGNLLIGIGAVLAVGLVAGGISTWQLKPKPLDPFMVYKNSGDSIIGLQKQELRDVKYVNHSVALNRLIGAKNYYTKALLENADSPAVNDSISGRIEAIDNIFPVLEQYKGVCDTLDFVIKEDLPTQVEIFSAKRDEISKMLKQKIQKL